VAGPPRPSTHTRAFSFSTVDDSHKSSELKDGVLRVVIDRSAASRPKTAEDLFLPSLEIPIPHHRLGKPHFSVQGTPILRSSAYTRTSEGVSENLKSFPAVKNDLLSPAATVRKKRGLSDNRSSDTVLGQGAGTTEALRDSPGGAPGSTNYSYTEHVDPEVFDRLANFKDDASVVRYSHRTGAITAATPARIVAQISSESFMDYELVSDFFLTFRAYLSTESLLNLLLARLRWAINRLEDDGRIIRIRTFAALRHWILNYFVDDFVVNRKLRVRFCDQINEMYHEVAERTGGGVSDLKILLDLKRCWNGRCSLYWDSTDFVVDTHQDADIVPGGVLGSRDASLTQFDIGADQGPNAVSDTHQDEGSTTKAWHGRPPAVHGPDLHLNQVSSPSAGVPISPTSEQSLQAASCSIPARAFKRSPPPDGHGRGPYPVSIQLRASNSPAHPITSMQDPLRRLSQAHKRSASTSDSIRNPGSATSLNWPVYPTNPHAGSLIRGNVYPPAAPFVDVVAPDSPPSQRSRLNLSPVAMPTSFDSGAKPGSPANAGVKTFMGSIRRALSSSKQASSTSVSSVEDISRSAPSLRGRTSGLPLNMARSTDTLRDRKSNLPTKHHLRIDLLCAAVSQSYQMAQARASQDSLNNRGPGVPISDIHEDSASQPSLGSGEFSIEAGDVQCILSEEFAKSSSKMTDDADELDSPTKKMTLGGGVEGEARFADFDSSKVAMMSMPLLTTEHGANRKPSYLSDHRRSSSVDTAPARRSKERRQSQDPEFTSLSKGVRSASRVTTPVGPADKVNSTSSIKHIPQVCHSQSNRAPRHGPRPSLDATETSSSTTETQADLKSHGPAHALRRRPGCNLRNIEKVHDLATVARRQSTGSLTTRSESVGSMIFIGGNRPVGPKRRKPAHQVIQHPVSMIRTHSSQHLRPSFEAAISGFSAIPDHGDGGLEATLLKLEGRYEITGVVDGRTVEYPTEQAAPTGSSPHIDRRYRSNGQNSKLTSGRSPGSSCRSNPRSKQSAPVSKTRKPSTQNVSLRSRQSKSSVANSEGSYSSIPLLERGLTDGSMKKPSAFPRPNLTAAIPHPLSEKEPRAGTEQHSPSSHPSIEVVEKTDSIGRIPQGSTLPDAQPPIADDSFLLDEDDKLTDLSSELSVDVIDHSEARPRVISPIPGPATSGHELPIHPLAHPPSPAVSFHNAITSVPPVNPMMYQQKPLTPQPSPTHGDVPQGIQVRLSQILPQRKSAAIASATVTTSAGHIPFVLACESEVLAQQLTLVEKAALSEIDWTDLVDMKWDSKSPNILNWVEYLSAKDNRGIDIVITRFNIVVKWVLSEIVMTQNIHERAQAITKYIHIAAHARKMHNYATMLQITIALTSIDCTRLKATWELVADAEKERLKEMETLIQPIRNFHELRIEMETANLEDGCVPFVGGYLVPG
jgi:RasGEF domain/RasGEF N-terminal motif